MNALDNQSIPLPARLTLADAALAYANALTQEHHITALTRAMLDDGIADKAETNAMLIEAHIAVNAASTHLAVCAYEASLHVIPE